MARFISIQLFTCLLICLAIPVTAQDTVVLVPGPRWDSLYEMEKYARYYVDESGQQTAQQVIGERFVQDSNFLRTVRKKYRRSQHTAWIRWILYNPSPVPEQGVLKFSSYSFLSFYTINKNGVRFIKNNDEGFFTTQTKYRRCSFPFTVPAQSSVMVYAQMPDVYLNFVPEYPVIIRDAEWQQVVRDMLYEGRYRRFAEILFLSIIFFIMIHTLSQYFFNWRKEFLLYAFYAASVLLFFLFKFDGLHYVDITFSHFPYLLKYANNPLSYLMYYAYYRFVRSFINFKEIAPWFYKCILVTEKILLGAIVANPLLEWLHMVPVKIMLFHVLRSYLIVVACIGIYLLLRWRNTLALFIAVGSGLLIICALVSMLLSWMPNGPENTLVYMQVGVVLELLCFTLGLGYKTSLIEKEKIQAQQQLITQMEENKKLQDQLQTQLEGRVREQTGKILAQQQQLEKEREQQLMLVFTKKLTEMELQLLKSQLNPHFYFNTLNNLYGLAMISPKKAPDAILKLSDIMEYVIYDCRNDKVPLQKELRFITSYIELERLRYEGNANIMLDIYGEPGEASISPLLLIQFIENAFKHGMELHKSDCYLHIRILLDNDRLQFEAANSIKGATNGSGGVGLSNVKKRLDMLYPGRHELNICSGQQVFTVTLSLQLN
jgi:sensor histidine kinase YesM